MDATISETLPPVGALKRLLHRLLAIGENRFQLLVVEVEEGRDHVLNMVFHSLVAAVLGLLCGIALSAALVFALPISPVLTLLGLGAVYGISAFWLCRRLNEMRLRYHSLAATLEQLRKDRASLEGN
jgi:uncharacterized membrane protein YqjE